MDRLSRTSSQLLDFFNSGRLPFVGRAAEVARVGGLLSSVVEAGALRSVVVAGEAGVGKSRFAEALAGQFEAAGGISVVVRLYPDTAIAVAAPLAEAAARSVEGRGLLRDEPSHNLAGALAVLRRAARLRPTLLILDDLHLLTGNGVDELHRLLGALEDEPIALLGLFRPGNAPARAVLERSLAAELELTGLTVSELQPLLADLFPGAEEGALSTLHAATGGNMMAVRSALRSAVAERGLQPDATGRRWSVQRERFSAAMERSLELVVQGMVGHLGPDEYRAAARLSTLGMVFARETAAAVVDDPSILDILIFKGVLAVAVSPPRALGESESRRPLLAFTHNLLYRALREHAGLEPRALLRIAEEELPIYTIEPVRALAGAQFDPEWSEETLFNAVRHLLFTTRAMDKSEEWRKAVEPFNCAARLVQFAAGRWSAERWRILTCYLLYWRWQMRRREPASALRFLVDALDGLSRNPTTESEAGWRLKALRQQYRTAWEVEQVESPQVMEEIRQLVLAYTNLCFAVDYSHILFTPLTIAVHTHNYALIDEIERESERLLADPRCTEPARRDIHANITTYLLSVVRTPQELERRRAMIAETVGGGILGDQVRLAFRLECGEALQVLEEIPALIERMEVQGLVLGGADLRVREVFATWLLDGDTARAGGGLYLLENRSAGGTPHFSAWTLWATKLIANIRKSDDAPFPTELEEMIDADAGSIGALSRVLRAVRSHKREQMAPLLREWMGAGHWSFPKLGALLLDGEGVEPALEELREPVFSCASFASAMEGLDVALACEREEPQWKGALRERLEAILKWTDAAELGGAMGIAVRRFGSLLPTRERRKWQERSAELVAQFRRGVEREGLSLSMIGTIAVVRGGEAAAPVQGARSRTLLGLMTAAAMRRTPPEREEFWQIATGSTDPDELDRARKTMHQAVLRLREMLGPDAVRTDGDIPTLDSTVVRVDLLELHASLGEVEDDLRSGLLLRARPALLAVLGGLRDEVLFPTLYDDFFEAARQEFENRLRRAAVQASRALVREEDFAAAEELLRAALVAIPEDEEIADLLSTALEGLGRPADAALVRRRAERVV